VAQNIESRMTRVSVAPTMMPSMMKGMAEAIGMATAAYFAIYYACYPLIGNNALWLAFTLYMFLRGVRA